MHSYHYTVQVILGANRYNEKDMKIISLNRRAKHDYTLGDRFLAGISLEGHEVKSIKAGQITLKGSFVHLNNGEAFLTNAHIRQYAHAANIKDFDPVRPRKLLLKRKQLDELTAAKQSQGMTIVPTAVGVERGYIKVEIAIGQGKKHYDKRATQREAAMIRDAQMETRRRI